MSEIRRYVLANEDAVELDITDQPTMFVRTVGDFGDTGVGIQVFIGTDGATVVQIDTDENLGVLRVNVNDAPVFDQDPEEPSRIDYEALERGR